MRIRSIKPDFWKSEKVATLPPWSQLLFIGLWNLSDDDGRFRAHPNLIQGELFPYQPGADIEAWLKPLIEVGLVRLYEVDGRRYGLVIGFGEHQKIDKRTQSRLPPPPEVKRSAKPARRREKVAEQLAASTDFAPVPAESSGGIGGDSACSPEQSGLDWKGSGRGSGSREVDTQRDTPPSGLSTRTTVPVPEAVPGEPPDRVHAIAGLVSGAVAARRSRA